MNMYTLAAWTQATKVMPFYTKLQTKNSFIDCKEDEEFLLGDDRTRKSSRTRPSLLNIISWLLTAFFAGLYIYQVASKPADSQLGSFNGGFSTEFAPAFPYIELELRRFTSGVLFTPEGQPYRTSYENEPEYFGPPTPEIEQNWEALIGARYFSVTDEEAEQIADEENKKTWDKSADWGFMTGFDMLHSLHCINMVRKGLDGDYYYPEHSMKEHHSRNHYDHCLDHLRQSVMCHGDLTPMTSIYWPQIDSSFVHSEQWHVCRKYDNIRQYTTNRYNGSDAVVPLSRERFRAGKGHGRLEEAGHCPGCKDNRPAMKN